MAAANSLQEDGRAMAKSDVVKRGLLKFKSSKVKGTAGSSARGVSGTVCCLFSRCWYANICTAKRL